MAYVQLMAAIPSREGTYPTLAKGKLSSKVPWEGIC